MNDTFTTNAQFATQLWVPFNLSQTNLSPGSCTPLGVLSLGQGQSATLSWLTLHFVRLLAGYVPSKLNQSLNSVYVGLYGSEGSLIQVIPGQPLAYAGLDVPGVTQLSPAFAPHLAEPDTYTVLVVNNLRDAAVNVVTTGTWRVVLS